MFSSSAFVRLLEGLRKKTTRPVFRFSRNFGGNAAHMSWKKSLAFVGNLDQVTLWLGLGLGYDYG